MGETELRGNIMQGDGVYKSTDAGKHLEDTSASPIRRPSRASAFTPPIPTSSTSPPSAIPTAAIPSAACSAPRTAAPPGRRSFTATTTRAPSTWCLDPHNPNVLFAAIWDVNRTPWGLTSGGPGSGFFKSTDGGDHWTEITRNAGLPSGVIGKIGVAVSGGDSNRVYALVENAKGGLYVSDDAGATWKLINEDRTMRQRAFYYSRVYADPKAKDTVYVLNTSMFRSTDGGKTFRTIQAPHGDHHDLWIDPTNPQRMIEQQRWRRQCLPQRRPDVDRPAVSPPRSSITSP